MVPPHRRAGGGLEPAGRALEPPGRASEPARTTLKPAGRALEPAGRVSEQARRASQLGRPWSLPRGPQSQLGGPWSLPRGPQSQLGGPWSQLGGPLSQLGGLEQPGRASWELWGGRRQTERERQTEQSVPGMWWYHRSLSPMINANSHESEIITWINFGKK